jgi:hypothetical protein
VSRAAELDYDISDFCREPWVAHERGVEIFLLRRIVVVSNPDDRVVMEGVEDAVDGRPDRRRVERLCRGRTAALRRQPEATEAQVINSLADGGGPANADCDGMPPIVRLERRRVRIPRSVGLQNLQGVFR